MFFLQIVCCYFENLIYHLLVGEFKNRKFSQIFKFLKRHIKILYMPSISLDTGDTAVIKDKKSIPMPWICSKEWCTDIMQFRV